MLILENNRVCLIKKILQCFCFCLFFFLPLRSNIQLDVLCFMPTQALDPCPQGNKRSKSRQKVQTSLVCASFSNLTWQTAAPNVFLYQFSCFSFFHQDIKKDIYYYSGRGHIDLDTDFATKHMFPRDKTESSCRWGLATWSSGKQGLPSLCHRTQQLKAHLSPATCQIFHLWIWHQAAHCCKIISRWLKPQMNTLASVLAGGLNTHQYI